MPAEDNESRNGPDRKQQRAPHVYFTGKKEGTVQAVARTIEAVERYPSVDPDSQFFFGAGGFTERAF